MTAVRVRVFRCLWCIRSTIRNLRARCDGRDHYGKTREDMEHVRVLDAEIEKSRRNISRLEKEIDTRVKTLGSLIEQADAELGRLDANYDPKRFFRQERAMVDGRIRLKECASGDTPHMLRGLSVHRVSPSFF